MRQCAKCAELADNALDEIAGSPGEFEKMLAKHLACREDGRCQYAIDHGAEGLGHCPAGKCAMLQGFGPIDGNPHNTALENWFPYSAEEIDALRAENAKLREACEQGLSATQRGRCSAWKDRLAEVFRAALKVAE